MAREIISIRVNVDRENPDGYRRLGKRWIEGFSQTIVPDMWLRIQADDPLVDSGLTVVPRPNAPVDSTRFDLDKYRISLANLGDPVETMLISGATDDRTLHVGATSSDKLRIRLRAGFSVDPDSMSEDVGRLVDFLVGYFDDVDPLFGFASTYFGGDLHTELDIALRRQPDESIAAGREFLRGYSWLTIVPKELVTRLGGIRALQDSPVESVLALAGGGAIIIAAPTPVEYDDRAMRHLFEVVAPVLPSGKPARLFGYENLRVVYEDASSLNR